MPEAGLNLAHAVLHLALAPKSNSVKASLFSAVEAVERQKASPVPKHLRDGSYRGAAAARSRQGLRLSSRRAGGLGAAGAPARRSWPGRSSTGRDGTGPSLRSPKRWTGAAVPATKHERPTNANARRTEPMMDTSDVLAVVAATVVAILAGVLIATLYSLDAHAPDAPHARSSTCARKRSRCSTTRTTRSAKRPPRSTGSTASSARPRRSTTRSTVRNAWRTRRSRHRS